MASVSILAGLAWTYLTKSERDDGSVYIHMTDDRPDWVFEMIYEAHYGKLPNDWSYKLIEAALGTLAEGCVDEPYEFAEGMSNSLCNNELANWMTSHGERWDLCDTALQEFDHSQIAHVISRAFEEEAIAVYMSVQGVLEAQAEEEDA